MRAVVGEVGLPIKRLRYVGPFYFSVVMDVVEPHCSMLLSIEALKRMA